MFCKFCGETVSAGQKKCSRCGKDLPALSECSGYYNVIKNTASGNSSRNISPGVSIVQKTDAKAWVAIGILAVIALSAIILIFVLNSKIDALEDQINDLEGCACEQVVDDQDDFLDKLAESADTSEAIQEITQSSILKDDSDEDISEPIEETSEPVTSTNNTEEPTETTQESSVENNVEGSGDASDAN